METSPMPKIVSRRVLYLLAIAVVLLLSCGLRLYAVQRLPVDADEPVYVASAISYANSLRSGDYKMLAWNEINHEHPPLNKIAYALVLLTERPLDRLPDKDLPRLAPIAAAPAAPWAISLRYLSVFWATLGILALAVFNPLAGLFFGIDVLSVKYTSLVYLESLPLLSSLLCILAYRRWFVQISRFPASAAASFKWLLLAAFCLGITAASKYIYCVAGVGILLHFVIALVRRKVPLHTAYLIAGWALLSLLVFFIFDPYLWPHPVSRLIGSVTFHESFTGSRLVQQYHFPFWQPFLWLSGAFPSTDSASLAAIPVKVDPFIFLLAVLGLPALFRREPVFFCWLAVGIAFLLAWETKWPQYALVVLAPLSLSAANAVSMLWDLARKLVAHPGSQPR